MSSKAKAKAEKEIAEFTQFAVALSKWVVVTAIRSQPQGYADIAAAFSGETIGFELLSIVDEDLAAQNGLSDWANVDQKISAKLLTKNYSDNCPIELLIYSKATFLTTDTILHDSQVALWRDGLGPFRRVWLLTEDNRVFLFHKNWWSEVGILP